MFDNAALLKGLKSLRCETLATLDKALAPNGQKTFVLAQRAPRHGNVGDSMIWLGTIRYLKAAGIRLRGVYDLAQGGADRLPQLPHDCTIIFGGGGNFGDLYPEEQESRYEVMARFPGHDFVFLPQSVHFESAGKRAECAEELSKLRNVAFLARERSSVAAATESFPGVRVLACHDMAFSLGPFEPEHRVRNSIYGVLRQDSEVGQIVASEWFAENQLPYGDWSTLQEVPTEWRRLHGLLDRSGSISRSMPQLFITRRIVSRMAALLTNRGVAQLRGNGAIVSDRLHAVILSNLIGVPALALDNSYGKVHGVVDYSMARLSNTRIAESLTALEDYRATFVGAYPKSDGRR